jgi:hypothetical protein
MKNAASHASVSPAVRGHLTKLAKIQEKLSACSDDKRQGYLDHAISLNGNGNKVKAPK